MKEYFCLVIDRYTGSELWECRVEAAETYYARHKVVDLYMEAVVEGKAIPSRDWYVDSCEI